MIEKIKNFVKAITPTTWILIGVGVVAGLILGLSVASGKGHKKHEEQKVHVVAPAAK